MNASTNQHVSALFRFPGDFRTITAAAILCAHLSLMAVSVSGPALILSTTITAGDGTSPNAWSNVFASWDRWATLLTNTGIASGLAITVTCLLGLLLALLLFKLDLRGRSSAIAFLLLAAAVPVYVVTGAVLSVIPIEVIRESAPAVGLIHALAHLPLVVILIGMALQAVPAEIEENALVDGASGLGSALWITCRLSLGAIVAAGVLVSLWVSTDYTVSDILLVRTFAEEVYTQYALVGRPEEPALVAVPQIVMFCALLWLMRRVFWTASKGHVPSGKTLLYRVGPWRGPLSVFATIAPLGFVVFLIAALTGPLRPVSETFRTAGWFVEEVSLSLISGIVAGGICALGSIGLAWAIVRKPRWRPLILAYLLLTISIPAPVSGMGLIRVFNRPGVLGWIYDSPAMLVIAYVIRFLPIAVVLVIPAVRATASELEDAARLDGANAVEILYRIVAARCAAAMLVALFVVTILSIGELACSQMVTPPGYVTVAARFFSLVHYGMYPDAAMLCLLSIVSVAVPCAALYLLVRRRLLT